MPFDRPVGDALHRWTAGAPSWFVDVLGALTDLGSPATFYVLAIPVVLGLVIARRFVDAAFIAVAVWVGGWINITTLVWSRLPPRWRPPAIAAVVVVVLAIGFTRVALGVHHLSDVLGAYAMGAGWLALCAVSASRFGARWGLRR